MLVYLSRMIPRSGIIFLMVLLLSCFQPAWAQLLL